MPLSHLRGNADQYQAYYVPKRKATKVKWLMRGEGGGMSMRGRALVSTRIASQPLATTCILRAGVAQSGRIGYEMAVGAISARSRAND